MVDLAVAAQLQQWTFAKPSPTDTDAAAPAPELYNGDVETLRISPAADAVRTSTRLNSKETLSLQHRYLSSEEDLSPNEGNSDNDSEDDDDDDDDDDDVSIHEANAENLRDARKVNMSRYAMGNNGDRAVTVSYVSAGRAKVVELANPTPIATPTSTSAATPTANLPSPAAVRPSGTAQRSASLAQLPVAAIHTLRKVDQSSRLSLAVTSTRATPSPRSQAPTPIPTSASTTALPLHSASRPASPAYTFDQRRPSTSMSHLPFNPNSSRISPSGLHNASSSSSSTSSSASFITRSSSPSILEAPPRPSSAFALPTAKPRSSLRISAALRPNRVSSLHPFPPLTPQSPERHSFLNTDPFEHASIITTSTATSTATTASVPKTSSPHRRLRSISQKLSLAKIAITPSKKWDARTNGKPSMPPTPITPLTPQTAPIVSSSSSAFAAFASPKNKLRRNSRISLSRPGSVRGPSPEVPPVPALAQDPSPRKQTRIQRLVPRGAGERAPILELPPCPPEPKEPETPVADSGASIKSRRIRKRKSLMDLL